MTNLEGELKRLKEKLEENIRQQEELKKEEKELHTKIEQISVRVGEVEKAHSKNFELVSGISQSVATLTSEVAFVRQVVEKNQQDLQLVIQLVQSIQSGQQGQVMGNKPAKAEYVAGNRAAMAAFTARIQKLVADTFKKDYTVEKLFNDLLANIAEG